MKKLLTFLVCLWLIGPAFSQSPVTSKTDVKLGIGPAYLGSGDLFILKLEGELTQKWNRIFSGSASASLGYGKALLYSDQNRFNRQKAFTYHIDGNVFVSPFGNHHWYNLKLGTGLSLMFVRDSYPSAYGSISADNRLALGMNMILENEFRVGERSLLGFKAMMQPYFNGDISSSFLVKFGRIL